MKATLAEIMKALPDFEDLDKLAGRISDLLYQKLVLEKEIKSLEATVYRRCMTEKDLFNGDKPYPVSYIESAFRHTGIDGELLGPRDNLARVVSELERERLRLDLYKSMLDIWRTLSANERSSSLT